MVVLEHCLRQSEPQMSRTKDRIAHAGNRGEHIIMIGRSKVYVDRFDRFTNKVYEFLGDFYHGCPVIFPDCQMRHPKHDDNTTQEVYEEAIERLKAIKKAGYVVEVIWEDGWNQLKREREEVREFSNRLELVTRLEPRDACFWR